MMKKKICMFFAAGLAGVTVSGVVLSRELFAFLPLKGGVSWEQLKSASVWR